MDSAETERALSCRFRAVDSGTALVAGARGLPRLESVDGNWRSRTGVRAVFPERAGTRLGRHAQRVSRLYEAPVGAVCCTVAAGLRPARARLLGCADSACGRARMTVARRKFDCLVIGAGGGGLRAALQLAEGEAHVAVVSKVFPTRSHTVAAQGGMNAALGNVSPDNWHWHMYDTIKGGDFLADQDAVEYMCRAAARQVIELEHYGVPFPRLDNGRIYQRPFGGQSQDFGGAQAARTCPAADRTGHAILHTLYQQNIKARTHFFDEFFAIDLLRDSDGYQLGALVLEIETGEPLIIEAKSTLIATGGAARMYRTCTNAMINTGDGMAMALRAGIPLQDMEVMQFHPTGIAGRGVLIAA